MQNGVMLDGRGDDVVPREGAKAIAPPLIAALSDSVPPLVNTTSFARHSSAFATMSLRILQRLPGALPYGVDAGRVAVGFLQVRHHGLQRLRPQGRGRGVVQIDIALARVHQSRLLNCVAAVVNE